MKAMSLVLFACASCFFVGCANDAKPAQDKPAAGTSAAPASSAAPAATPAKAEEKKEGGW